MLIGGLDDVSSMLPTLYLCRHGDTAWSPYRRFAGRTDIPLTEEGERNALQLGRRLKTVSFTKVVVSPLSRARRTAQLAGYEEVAEIDSRLAEWNFGQYEGKLRDDVVRERPGWTYLRDGCPGGETAECVGQRADELLGDLKKVSGTVLLFGHSVILRVLTARWLGLSASQGCHFLLSPASVSILSFDPVDDAPAILLWNDKSHLGE